jgi:Fe-S-cluster containining protein
MPGCKQCGQCCRADAGWDFAGVRFSPGDIARAALHLGLTAADFAKIYCVVNGYINIAETGSCPFLAGNKCLIYEVRPDFCARYTCNGARRGIASNGGSS